MGDTSEVVYTVEDYYDGPRPGIANYHGVPHVYRSVFDYAKDDWDEEFVLQPIDDETLRLALESWSIWIRWRQTFDGGQTTIATHPALPAERHRYDELKALLEPRLAIEPNRAIRVRGRFTVENSNWVVYWSDNAESLKPKRGYVGLVGLIAGLFGEDASAFRFCNPLLCRMDDISFDLRCILRCRCSHYRESSIRKAAELDRKGRVWTCCRSHRMCMVQVYAHVRRSRRPIALQGFARSQRWLLAVRRKPAAPIPPHGRRIDLRWPWRRGWIGDRPPRHSFGNRRRAATVKA